jgi:hypothetical protein
MAYTFQELRKKTVAELRAIAKGMEHEAVQGHTQMNKERLIGALCTALGIEMRERHEVKGLDKASIKARIRELKKARDEALTARDHAKLKAVRRRIHHFKRMLRDATV